MEVWMRNFLNGDDPDTYPPRVDITEKQRKFLDRMWICYAVGVLGFALPLVPDAIPYYSEKNGFIYRPAIKRHYHHIVPVGESLRLDGRDDYNRPENLVPVSARRHVGQGVHEGDEDEDEVLHPDTMEAFRSYGKFKQAGGPNPMHEMHEYRRGQTERGLIYHNDMYDQHLISLAQEVCDYYRKENPNDQWSIKVHTKQSTVDINS